VQPCLGGGVVVLGIDRFVVDRCGVATGADDLLRPPALSGGHESATTLIPQLVAMSDRNGNRAYFLT
jgi:hypothetical protein